LPVRTLSLSGTRRDKIDANDIIKVSKRSEQTIRINLSGMDTAIKRQEKQ